MNVYLIIGIAASVVTFVLGMLVSRLLLKDKSSEFLDFFRTSNDTITTFSNILNTDNLLKQLLDAISKHPAIDSVGLIKIDPQSKIDVINLNAIQDKDIQEVLDQHTSYRELDNSYIAPGSPIFRLLPDSSQNIRDIHCHAFSIPVIPLQMSYMLLVFYRNKKWNADSIKYIKSFQFQLQLILYYKDFTQRYRENYELLDNVFFRGPLPMGICDPGGALSKANSKFNMLFTPAIQNIQEIVPSEQLTEIFRGNAIETDLNYNQKFLKIQGFPVYSDKGEVSGGVFIIIDESIQYLLYRKLEISEKRYRKLIKKLPVGLAILNKDSRIYFVNDNFMFSLGLANLTQLQGRNLTDFFDFEDEDIEEILSETDNVESQYYKFNSKPEYGNRIFSVNLRKVELGEEDLIEAVFQDISLENALYTQLDEKTRLLEEELNTAKIVQEHILAIPPIYTPGIRFHTLYKPSYQLGGDFFDIIPIDDNHLGVIIADVAGHGVSASLITAMLKILVEFAPKDPHKLNEMMSYLNTGLLKIIPEDSFITMFYGIIDTVQYKMQYINCGHPFPLVYDDKQEKVEILKGMGFPLGSLQNLSFEDLLETVTLPSDGKLLLYTDGIMNFKKNDSSINFEGMKNVFEKSADLRTRDILDDVYVNIVKNATSFSEDDISMLLLIFNRKIAYKNYLSIPSNVLEIDLAIVKILSAISKKIALGEEDEWKLYTALYEAMINAVEHGNKFNVQKRVTIIYRIFAKNWLAFKIRDDGPGFKPNSIPDPLAQENLLKPSGRGLFMIFKMMKKVRYNKSGNEITMYMQISGE